MVDDTESADAGHSGGVTVERVADGVVIRPAFDGAPRVFADLTDDDWNDAWELPVRSTIEAMRTAIVDGVRRIVVVIPVTAMSGGAQYAHVAAPAEAIRLLAMSTARQWAADGVCINVVAVAPDDVLDEPALARVQPLGSVGIGRSVDTGVLVELLCSTASEVTGQTIAADGGVWM